MARQNFDRSNNVFELDLHGCSMEEGRAVVGQRIRECYRYGIEELKVIYGSVNRAEGTLREAVGQAIGGAGRSVVNCSYRDSRGMFAEENESTEMRITLAPNSHPQTRDRNMVFAGFMARYDTACPRHEPYYPLRSDGGAKSDWSRTKGSR